MSREGCLFASPRTPLPPGAEGAILKHIQEKIPPSAYRAHFEDVGWGLRDEVLVCQVPTEFEWGRYRTLAEAACATCEGVTM